MRMHGGEYIANQGICRSACRDDLENPNQIVLQVAVNIGREGDAVAVNAILLPVLAEHGQNLTQDRGQPLPLKDYSVMFAERRVRRCGGRWYCLPALFPIA